MVVPVVRPVDCLHLLGNGSGASAVPRVLRAHSKRTDNIGERSNTGLLGRCDGASAAGLSAVGGAGQRQRILEPRFGVLSRVGHRRSEERRVGKECRL